MHNCPLNQIQMTSVVVKYKQMTKYELIWYNFEFSKVEN